MILLLLLLFVFELQIVVFEFISMETFNGFEDYIQYLNGRRCFDTLFIEFFGFR